EPPRRQGAVGESPVVLSVRACQDDVRGRSFVSRVVDLADRCRPFRELPAGRHQRQERRSPPRPLPPPPTGHRHQLRSASRPKRKSRPARPPQSPPTPQHPPTTSPPLPPPSP